MRTIDHLNLNPEIDRILNPKSYFLKKTWKYVVSIILSLSQQYSDIETFRMSQIQWYTIYQLYNPTITPCASADQLQWIQKPDKNTLQIIDCTTRKVIIEWVLRVN